MFELVSLFRRLPWSLRRQLLPRRRFSAIELAAPLVSGDNWEHRFESVRVRHRRVPSALALDL